MSTQANPAPSPAPAPSPTPAPAQESPAPAPAVSEAEITSRVEKAREEEKRKLYGQIESLKASLDAEKTRASQLEAELAKVSGELDSLKKSISSDSKTVDVEKLINEITEKAAATASQQIVALQQKLESLEKENRASQLEAYRVKAIAEAGGERSLIVELVRGETKEEIDASVEAAKAAYARITANVGVSPAAPPAAAPSAPVPPAPPTPGGPTAPVRKSVKEMTPEEYKAHRDEILREATERMRRSVT